MPSNNFFQSSLNNQILGAQSQMWLDRAFKVTQNTSNLVNSYYVNGKFNVPTTPVTPPTDWQTTASSLWPQSHLTTNFSQLTQPTSAFALNNTANPSLFNRLFSNSTLPNNNWITNSAVGNTENNFLNLMRMMFGNMLGRGFGNNTSEIFSQNTTTSQDPRTVLINLIQNATTTEAKLNAQRALLQVSGFSPDEIDTFLGTINASAQNEEDTQTQKQEEKREKKAHRNEEDNNPEAQTGTGGPVEEPAQTTVTTASSVPTTTVVHNHFGQPFGIGGPVSAEVTDSTVDLNKEIIDLQAQIIEAQNNGNPTEELLQQLIEALEAAGYTKSEIENLTSRAETDADPEAISMASEGEGTPETTDGAGEATEAAV